jgi:hypothetical protein
MLSFSEDVVDAIFNSVLRAILKSTNNASRLFGFFNAHPLNQASLFRGFALKKPVTL